MEQAEGIETVTVVLDRIMLDAIRMGLGALITAAQKTDAALTRQINEQIQAAQEATGNVSKIKR